MSTQAAMAPVTVTAPAQGRRWKSALRSKKTMCGLVIIGFFIVIAIIGPWIAPHDPSTTGGAPLAAPSGSHLLGTTQTGQDVLSQLIVGTRISMLVGFIAAAIASVLSVVVGLAGGYFGGIIDEVLDVISNVFLVIPSLPLVIVLAGYLPSRGSLSVAVVISVTGWAWGARVMRAQTLSIRRRDYVEAARATGESTVRILFVEILPNELAIVAANFLGTVTFAILTQAGLAFLGLSDVSSWSWGTMLYWAQSAQALELGAWWWFIPPGLCIALVGTGLVMINFGIDEFINPRLRGSGLAQPRRRRRLALRQRRVASPTMSAMTGTTQVERGN
jgi:peptide/nickel transport system permease protein